VLVPASSSSSRLRAGTQERFRRGAGCASGVNAKDVAGAAGIQKMALSLGDSTFPPSALHLPEQNVVKPAEPRKQNEAP